jgi:nucleotide-binding universal stress UspA family protein
MPTKTTGNHQKPILVAVDFSRASESALLFAASLAESTGNPLTVLHVVHDPGDAPGYYVIPGRLEQLGRMEDVASTMLDDFLAELRRAHPDLIALKQATTLLVVGLPVPRIMEVIEQVDAHMLVMGSSGRTGLHRLMLGSKALQAAHVCPVPITIVRAPHGTESGT